MAITLRDVVASDAPALAHVLVTSERDSLRGLVPDVCLTFTETESATNWGKLFARGIPENDVMIVAEDAGRVIGYAWGGPVSGDRVYAGELHQIAVLTAYQGQGVGRLLVRHIARRLAEQGIHSMKVGVLRVNPNRPFYERLGATYVSEHALNWRGTTLPECVYGWQDTQSLMS